MEEEDHNSTEDEELRDMVEKALKDNLKSRKSFKKRKDLANRLANILCEYLDSYILLGYDFSGDDLLRFNGQKVDKVTVRKVDHPGEYN